MSYKRPSYILLLTICALLVGLVAGCGGSGGQSKDQQNGGSKDRQQESGSNKEGNNTSGDSPETKMALGKIASVKLDNQQFTLRASKGGERTVFKLRENTKITLNGKEAKQEYIRRGQQAQIRYVVRNERKQAIEVTLFGVERTTGGGGTGG